MTSGLLHQQRNHTVHQLVAGKLYAEGTLHSARQPADTGRKEIQILVERPFWLTFWAFLVYALLIIGATYAFLRYQLIKRERKTSEEKINFFTHARMTSAHR